MNLVTKDRLKERQYFLQARLNRISVAWKFRQTEIWFIKAFGNIVYSFSTHRIPNDPFSQNQN